MVEAWVLRVGPPLFLVGGFPCRVSPCLLQIAIIHVGKCRRWLLKKKNCEYWVDKASNFFPTLGTLFLDLYPK